MHTKSLILITAVTFALAAGCNGSVGSQDPQGHAGARGAGGASSTGGAGESAGGATGPGGAPGSGGATAAGGGPGSGGLSGAGGNRGAATTPYWCSSRFAGMPAATHIPWAINFEDGFTIYTATAALVRCVR